MLQNIFVGAFNPRYIRINIYHGCKNEIYIYIHVGYAKTGTTSIQRYLHDNRGLLLKKYSVFYPELDKKSYKHKYLCASSLSDGGLWRQAASSLAANPADTVVFSDEAFSIYQNLTFTQKNFLFIQDLFPGYTIRIVMYIRREDERIKSHYGQYLKLLRQFNYIPHYNRWLRESSISEACFWRLPQTIRFVRNLMGDENVIIRFYHEDFLKKGDVVCDFLDVLGLPFPLDILSEIPCVHENVSLPPMSFPFLVHLCKSTPEFELNRKKNLRNLVRACFSPDAKGKTDFFENQAVQENLDEIEALCPGYKSLYDNRPISWDLQNAEGDLGLVLNAALNLRISHIFSRENDAGAKLEKRTLKEMQDLTNQVGDLLRHMQKHGNHRGRFQILQFLKNY